MLAKRQTEDLFNFMGTWSFYFRILLASLISVQTLNLFILAANFLIYLRVFADYKIPFQNLMSRELDSYYFYSTLLLVYCQTSSHFVKITCIQANWRNRNYAQTCKFISQRADSHIYEFTLAEYSKKGKLKAMTSSSTQNKISEIAYVFRVINVSDCQI